MAAIEYKIDSAGHLREPNLHDANLLSVECAQSDAIFKFELVNGGIVQIRFLDVDQMVCHDFRHGNIVLDVTVDHRKRLSGKELEMLFTPPLAAIDAHQVHLSKVKDRIERGEMMLVTIAPSYGCEAMIYCASVNFDLVES